MPVINRGDDYFAVVTYTGNGTSQTISGLRFQPDFVWIKGRSGATDHALYDAQRGVQKRLESNTTDAEVSSDNGVTAFNSDGFSIGSLAQVNTNGATYVAWCWKEGATQGFDIVTYTGTGSNTTIAHNLGVAPRMMIVKRRSGASDWIVWHSTFAGTEYIALNTTAAKVTGATIWNSTSPTSSVFSVGTSGATNGNTDTYVAYLFSEVSQFSKAFSFTGNGSADGVFVFTGFLPRLILLKRTDTTGNWYLWDTARNAYNALGEELYPNLSNAAASATDLDVLSNGFKMRNSTAGFNASGGTYIGFAWASNPFKYSLGF
jgi:hypothetical protein